MWEVRYLNWEAYANALQERGGQLWTDLLKADIIMGGINFATDFL